MNKTTSDEQDAAALLLKEEQVSHAVLGLFKAPFCPSNKLLQKFIKLPRAASREQSTDKAEHVSDNTLKLSKSCLQARLGMRSQEFTWKLYTTPSVSASREPNQATKRQILV